MSVDEAFEEFKSRLELDESYEQLTIQRHRAIREVIEREIPTARTQLIGSVKRRTRIDPLTGLDGFDIDVLVELGFFTGMVRGGGKGITCDYALDLVQTAIAKNLIYRRMGVEVDRPAIIVPYDDGNLVEIVPAYKDRDPSHKPSDRAYYVPRTSSWHLADYDYDADVIAFTNQRLDGLLVPCIKMLKAWGRNVASQLRSYHLEVLALVTVPHVLALLDRMGSARKWPAILAGVFEFLDLKIQYDVRIDGSLSEPPDYYLGTPERMAAIDAAKLAARTAAYARTLSDADAIAAWRGIFGDPFPRGDV